MHLYLLMAVLLLTDVIENFRKFWWNKFHIEPLYKFGLPGVSWAAMQKNNYEIAQETKKLEITNPNYNPLKIKPIELLTDETMRLFFKQGRRGGISQASIRYLKKEEGEDILYIDANNLYGWAMLEPLPHSNYE